MEFQLTSFILDNLEAAGVIGGYVSISIIGFALISFLTKNKTNIDRQIGPRWLHPIVGGLMGAIPGCGATIVVASLYKEKKISFGGLFATFISTLGEGSFVLLGASDEADVAGNLKAYATITIFGLVAGIVSGYIVNGLGFGTHSDKGAGQSFDEATIDAQPNVLATLFIDKIGFLLIIVMAIFLAPGSIMALWGGSIESIGALTYWISVCLTLTCILYYIVDRISNSQHDCYTVIDIKSSLLHAVGDVAMVVTYVFLGLIVANYLIDVVVGPDRFDAWMKSSATVVVLLAAIIGVTPGCGGMIAVAVAFITIPQFPMAALVAAAIATSGDGIFPLLAENKKDGLLVSLGGFIVALIVGYIALLLGI